MNALLSVFDTLIHSIPLFKIYLCRFGGGTEINIMTDKELMELYKNSSEISPRAEWKQQILERAEIELASKNVIKESKPTQNFTVWKKLVPMAACLVLALLSVIGLLGLMNENYQTVYIDVNPSASLEINRFGNVSGVEYINEDAQNALEGIKLKGKNAEDALEFMLAAYENAGYFEKEADVYISALSETNKNVEKLLDRLGAHAESVKGNRKYTVNTAKVTAEDLELAAALGISPGKYHVIKQIIEEISGYTVEELKGLSMKELKTILNLKTNKK